MLAKMLPIFRLGLGGRLGHGHQWWSWIHLDDWLAIAETLIADPAATGPFNATAPEPVTNQEFTEILANKLHRPALLPLPASLLKWFLGERSTLLLESQRVIPERMLQYSFKFHHERLSSAFDATLADT
jgi:uncharacterized protein (TIGR01777 family)